MSATRINSTYSLGATLERDRLERGVRRATVAVAALRASVYRRELTPPPRHLRCTIDDFESQINAMNARLRDLAVDRGAIQTSERSGSDENSR
jgi:hypothetical protein